MAHHNTVFVQMLKFIPRHEFESLAHQYHSGRRLRKMTRWAQFVAMATAQLSGRHSRRDVASNLTAQARKLYLPPGYPLREPVFLVQSQRLSTLPVV